MIERDRAFQRNVKPTLERPAIAMLILLACFYATNCDDSVYEPGFTDPPDAIAQHDEDPLGGGSGGGITVPTKGESDDGGTFRGTIKITGAAFDPDLGPVLVVEIHGSLTGGSSEDGDPTENSSLNFGPSEIRYNDQVRGDDDCIELELSPASEFDPETKRTIEFETSRIATRTLPGPANIIADLICANDQAAGMGWSWEEAPQ